MTREPISENVALKYMNSKKVSFKFLNYNN